MLPGLLQGLQSVFDKIHQDNQLREEHQEKIIEAFSDRQTLAFEQSHQEAMEREKLLQEKLEAIEREQSWPGNFTRERDDRAESVVQKRIFA